MSDWIPIIIIIFLLLFSGLKLSKNCSLADEGDLTRWAETATQEEINETCNSIRSNPLLFILASLIYMIVAGTKWLISIVTGFTKFIWGLI